MNVSPGHKFIERFGGGIHWYIIDSKDFIPKIGFILNNANGDLVSFNGQSITLRLSVKEVFFVFVKNKSP